MDLRPSPLMIRQIDAGVRDGTPEFNNKYAKSMRVQALEERERNNTYAKSMRVQALEERERYRKCWEKIKEKNLEGTEGKTYPTETKQKKIRCIPRCLLLGVAVMILIAGFVAVIAAFKENDRDERLGRILPNPTKCTNMWHELGKPISITCNSDPTQKPAKSVKVISPNQALKSISFELKLTPNKDETHEWIIKGPNVTCSSEGTYVLEFYNETGDKVDNATAVLHINHTASTVVTKIKQTLLYKYDMNQTAFEVKCSVSNVCKNFEVDFIARSEITEEHKLNNVKTCDVNYKDDNGYTIQCEGTLKGSLVQGFRYMGCRMTHRETVKEKEFLFPLCGVQDCQYDCSSKSEDYKALDDGDCEYLRRKQCFKANREIYSYHKCPENNYPCPANVTVKTCRLNWCKRFMVSTKLISSEDKPGPQICPDFVEKTATTT